MVVAAKHAGYQAYASRDLNSMTSALIPIMYGVVQLRVSFLTMFFFPAAQHWQLGAESWALPWILVLIDVTSTRRTHIFLE